jgi:ubiquinone/menaquinone biosynthesis C-methylase UbiE
VEKIDYKDDAEAYEVEETSRPDEMLMVKTGALMARKYLDNLSNAYILDLCCGTGLSLIDVIGHPNIGNAVGVDNSKEYLEFARERFKDIPNLSLYLGDAVEHKLPHNQWDIVIMISAYHHIEDDRKVRFLQRVKKLLKPDGKAIIGENILPHYKTNDSESYKDAVRLFYREVLSTALEENPSLPDKVRRLIWRVAEYGCDGDYEYKSNMKIFLEHISQSGLKLIYQEKVWPFIGNLAVTCGGNYVFVAERAL